MDRRAIWSFSALLGAVSVVLASLALLAVVAWIALLLPFVRRAGLLALSGVLTGFGALWSFLMWRQSGSAGPTDNAVGWTLVGLVPLAVGLALLACLVVRGWAGPACGSSGTRRVG